jgi:hypothetical protein
MARRRDGDAEVNAPAPSWRRDHRASAVRDSTCIDAAAATARAEGLVAEGISAIHGRGLLGRDRRDPDQRRRAERDREDLAVCHLAGPSTAEDNGLFYAPRPFGFRGKRAGCRDPSERVSPTSP